MRNASQFPDVPSLPYDPVAAARRIEPAIYERAGDAMNVPINPATTVFQDVNGNPIQYFDGQDYFTLQADHVPSADGTITYYIQRPSTYDQTIFDQAGDDDFFGSPAHQWRYNLVSGLSADMTSSESVKAPGRSGTRAATPASPSPTPCTIPGRHPDRRGLRPGPGDHAVTEPQRGGGTFADLQVYKSLSVLDTFPIGDPEVAISFLRAQYPGASFVGKTTQPNQRPDNNEIELAFAKNITTYFNTVQQALIPQ